MDYSSLVQPSSSQDGCIRLGLCKIIVHGVIVMGPNKLEKCMPFCRKRKENFNVQSLSTRVPLKFLVC